MNLLPASSSTIAQQLADAFREVPAGGTITYANMTDILGFPIKNRTYLIPKARKLANREAGALFRNIPLVGYERLPSSETSIYLDRGLRLVRNRSRSFFVEARHAVEQANDMPAQVEKDVYARLSVLGLITHLTYKRNLPAPPTAEKPPPVSETVRASVAALRLHREASARAAG